MDFLWESLMSCHGADQPYVCTHASWGGCLHLPRSPGLARPPRGSQPLACRWHLCVDLPFLCFALAASAKPRCQILHPGSADAGAAFTSKSCISLLSPEERHEFCISSPTKPCFTSSRIKWLPGRRKDSGTERGSANGSSRNLSRAPRATHGAVRVLTARCYGHHHRVYVMSLLVGLTQPR